MTDRISDRTIAIGDIHGCAEALHALLTRIQPQNTDTIVTLGDYIDRGSDSHSVVERLLRLSEECAHVPLLGNHEALLLSALKHEADANFWLQCGGRETLQSYGWNDATSNDDVPSNDWGNSIGNALSLIPDSHIEFFRSCSLAYETDKHIFVHANYDPDSTIDEQVEHTLLWKHLNRGIPAPHVSGKTVIVGHTPQTSGAVLDVGHLICIDTFCFGSGCLTAFDVDSKQIWQVDRDGEPR